MSPPLSIPPAPPQARLSGDLDSDDEDAAEDTDDDDEDIRTIDDLAASVGVQPDDDTSSSSSAAEASAGAAEVSEEEAEKLARWQDMAAKLGSMDQKINETVEAIEQALMQGSGGSGGASAGAGRLGFGTACRAVPELRRALAWHALRAAPIDAVAVQAVFDVLYCCLSAHLQTGARGLGSWTPQATTPRPLMRCGCLSCGAPVVCTGGPASAGALAHRPAHA